jgi:hypothetical protein
LVSPHGIRNNYKVDDDPVLTTGIGILWNRRGLRSDVSTRRAKKTRAEGVSISMVDNHSRPQDAQCLTSILFNHSESGWKICSLRCGENGWKVQVGGCVWRSADSETRRISLTETVQKFGYMNNSHESADFQSSDSFVSSEENDRGCTHI